VIAISCKETVKKFENTKALNGINFEIEENKIYGLLGRNGAGKTTLLRTISNELILDSGEIRVFGEEVFNNKEALDKICLTKEKLIYRGEFRVKEILKNSSDFFKNWDDYFAYRLVREFKLDESKRYKNMSKGMQSIVGIIVGLASRAPVTMYDEPYLGLDAAARQKFYDILINDYYENPRTIIFSTHLIDEMSKLFEEIIIINMGRVILKENAESLRSRAYYVSGSKSSVDKYIGNKRVLYTNMLGNIKSAAILFEDERDSQFVDEGIEFSPIPLQKLFIYLTEGDGGENHE
jgi:ABC-2 type transport system ATP-binding protein